MFEDRSIKPGYALVHPIVRLMELDPLKPFKAWQCGATHPLSMGDVCGSHGAPGYTGCACHLHPLFAREGGASVGIASCASCSMQTQPNVPVITRSAAQRPSFHQASPSPLHHPRYRDYEPEGCSKQDGRKQGAPI